MNDPIQYGTNPWLRLKLRIRAYRRNRFLNQVAKRIRKVAP